MLKINELGILPTKLFILPKCYFAPQRIREGEWQICRMRINGVEKGPAQQLPHSVRIRRTQSKPKPTPNATTTTSLCVCVCGLNDFSFLFSKSARNLLFCDELLYSKTFNNNNQKEGGGGGGCGRGS